MYVRKVKNFKLIPIYSEEEHFKVLQNCSLLVNYVLNLKKYRNLHFHLTKTCLFGKFEFANVFGHLSPPVAKR